MRLFCLLFLLALPVMRGFAASPPVTLQDAGKEVTLSNGILAARIVKSSAGIASLRYRGFDMIKPNGGYYSMDGGKDYRTPANCRFRIEQQSPDLVDIAMTRVWKDEPQAFDIDIHYLLRQGDSGLYSYATLSHPAAYPSTGYGEWRMVWKLSDDLLEKIYVDDLRHWTMQRSTDTFETTPIKEIIKITSGVRAGQYDCKYDYSASYYDLGCWGHASDRSKVGAWMVLGSEEFLNDGPTKQDLNAAAGINHLHFGMNHYNGSGLRVESGQEWKKMYGPFLLYCNSAESADGCWADAKARVKQERAAWPYAWVKNPEYPDEPGRGTAIGTFAVHDPLKPAVAGSEAWIGLAQPPAGAEGKEEGNWQFDSVHYQYWSKVGEDGKFEIPHVRPGTYTLYAFATGATGEFEKRQVTVNAGRPTDVGALVWNVAHPGSRIAWEIGVPDRTAKEFRHGNDYFHGYLWQHFDRDFPNPLEYFVGRSDWSKDWNYAQARYGESEKPVAHRWRIHFALSEAEVRGSGEATLTLAIASAQRARIQVFVNDERRPFTEVSPKVQGGNALLREGIHAKYCVEYVKIPLSKLKAGENIVSLQLANVTDPSHHVMYDYLNLELP